MRYVIILSLILPNLAFGEYICDERSSDYRECMRSNAREAVNNKIEELQGIQQMQEDQRHQEEMQELREQTRLMRQQNAIEQDANTKHENGYLGPLILDQP